jgi:hypothetical protein
MCLVFCSESFKGIGSNSCLTVGQGIGVASRAIPCRRLDSLKSALIERHWAQERSCNEKH